MKRVLSFILLSLLFSLAVFPARASAEDTRQPVFLLCPHKERYSAWSIFAIVDKGDPSRLVGLGLERLKHQNSKDATYDAVVAAQRDPKTERELIGTLEAREFATGALEVKRDSALRISIAPAEKDFRLTVDMRVAADQRFVMGGKEQAKRDLLLRYDAAKKVWTACSEKLENNEGKPVVSGTCKPVSGLVFPVTGTGIYRVAAMVEGEPVVLLDR